MARSLARLWDREELEIVPPLKRADAKTGEELTKVSSIGN